MTWHFENDRPIYTQLLEQIRLRIISGIYAAGSGLPSVRELAADASVNPNTMQKALSGLEQEGLLYTKRTSGRFITNDQARIEALRIQVVTDSVRAWVREMRAYGVDDEMLEELVRKELNTHETD